MNEQIQTENHTEHFQIAIDGPSGAGKSTLAKSLAGALSITYLDTGAMYRAIGVAALDAGVGTRDAAAMAPLMQGLVLDVVFDGEEQRVLVNGSDITGRIRTPEASMAASDVSSLGVVREHLVAMQRRIAGQKSIVLDGRDIGTNVLPDAKYKFFITASPEERARRRMLQMQEKGEHQPYERVLEEVMRRDAQDSTRALNPLRPANDAHILNTDDMDARQTLEAILAVIRP